MEQGRGTETTPSPGSVQPAEWDSLIKHVFIKLHVTSRAALTAEAVRRRVSGGRHNSLNGGAGRRQHSGLPSSTHGLEPG